MNNFIQTIKSSTIGVVLAFYTATPLLAADIEIYTELDSAIVQTQPNILFVLDTSGSMSRDVDITVPTVTTTTTQVPVLGACPPPPPTPPTPPPTPQNLVYDSAIDYPGSCQSGRVFWSKDGSAPACNSNNYFYASSLHCNDSVAAFNNVGYYTGQLGQYKSKKEKWQRIKTKKNKERSYPIECQQDQGNHGDNSSNTNSKTYITNSNNGWKSSSTNPKIWRSGGNNYTIYDENYLNFLADTGASGTPPPVVSPPAPGSCSTGTFQTITTTTTTYQTVTSTRIAEMKKAIASLIGSSSNINVALQRFTNQSTSGPKLINQMQDVKVSRAQFLTDVASLNTRGGTPLGENFYEALQYFGGREIVGGYDGPPNLIAGAIDPNDSTKYLTPITESCQKNSIIFLSDGAPSRDSITGSFLQSALPNFSANCSGGTSDNCLEFLAGWALNNDVAYKPNFNKHVGNQNITTYTIGFDFPPGDPAEALLRRTAIAGGGSFFDAGDASSLTEAFNQIVAEILAVNSTFSSPAVSVNAFNRSVHLNDLYFTLFKPGNGAHWNGNIKKYKIDFAADGAPFIADADGNAAVDLSTGFFKDSARSYWTLDADAPDGKEAAAGGAAGVLTYGAGRNIYTYTGTYSDVSGVFMPSAGDLNISVNELDKANAGITDLLLGGVASKPPVVVNGNNVVYRTALLDWASGKDILDENTNAIFNEARRVMGDPLHSQPALIQYGGTSTNPDLVSFVATNDGYLHAINTADGTELWSFVPQELLQNLDDIFEDDGTLGKTYGLDGDVVAWVNDADNDGLIEPNLGEHVYLYVGMRRGGKNIYSLDVTNRNDPQLRWKIAGGIPGNAYEEMAETWSSVNVEKIKVGNTEKTVLIIGGGYDNEQDFSTQKTVDDEGRGIFIIDATTGALLWRAGPDSNADLRLTEMNYSIPSRVKPLDVDGDGFIDRLYVGDMGGQIWRFDIAESTATTASGKSTTQELTALITGGRIASLADNTTNLTNNNRRFYYPPDVALIVDANQGAYLAILAASGFRAHPLQADTHDRIYMIRDKDIYDAPLVDQDSGPGIDLQIEYTTLFGATTKPIVPNPDVLFLYDATDNLVESTTSATRVAAIADIEDAQGWYIDLDDEATNTFVGEKGLSEPLIFSNTAIITTYSPVSNGVSTGLCTPTNGTATIYHINIADGSPSQVDDDELGTRAKRKTLLKRGGIPPTPTIMIPPGGDPILCVGTECSSAANSLGITKTYWYEVENPGVDSSVSP